MSETSLENPGTSMILKITKVESLGPEGASASATARPPPQKNTTDSSASAGGVNGQHALTVLDGLHKLHQASQFCDLKVKARRGKNIYVVHACVLAAASPLLCDQISASYGPDMTVTVPTDRPIALRQLLEYVYTGSLSDYRYPETTKPYKLFRNILAVAKEVGLTFPKPVEKELQNGKFLTLAHRRLWAKHLLRRLLYLKDNQMFGDTWVMSADGGEFLAHSCIIAVQCPKLASVAVTSSRTALQGTYVVTTRLLACQIDDIMRCAYVGPQGTGEKKKLSETMRTFSYSCASYDQKLARTPEGEGGSSAAEGPPLKKPKTDAHSLPKFRKRSRLPPRTHSNAYNSPVVICDSDDDDAAAAADQNEEAADDQNKEAVPTDKAIVIESDESDDETAMEAKAKKQNCSKGSRRLHKFTAGKQQQAKFVLTSETTVEEAFEMQFTLDSRQMCCRVCNLIIPYPRDEPGPRMLAFHLKHHIRQLVEGKDRNPFVLTTKTTTTEAYEMVHLNMNRLWWRCKVCGALLPNVSNDEDRFKRHLQYHLNIGGISGNKNQRVTASVQQRPPDKGAASTAAAAAATATTVIDLDSDEDSKDCHSEDNDNDNDNDNDITETTATATVTMTTEADDVLLVE